MTREEFRKVRHAYRAFHSRYEHGGAVKPSFNDYRDASMLPKHYYFAAMFTRCTDPMLGRMRELKECAKKIREAVAYHAERQARNAIARAAYTPAFAAVLDQVDAELSRKAA
jgi:hypothetical protein